MKINKRPALQSISDNFYQQWNTVLYETEKRLAKLLLRESEKVIDTVEIDITRKMDKKCPDSADSGRISVHEKHKRFQQNQDITITKKWETYRDIDL